jgi:hypothetical protein
MVLALLGDNPMQSEFACHIGLRGKLFCRACWVKGTDALSEPVQEELALNRDKSDASDTGLTSDSGSAVGSDMARDGETDEGDKRQPSTSIKKTKGSRKKVQDPCQIWSRVSRIL